MVAVVTSLFIVTTTTNHRSLLSLELSLKKHCSASAVPSTLTDDRVVVPNPQEQHRQLLVQVPVPFSRAQPLLLVALG